MSLLLESRLQKACLTLLSLIFVILTTAVSTSQAGTVACTASSGFGFCTRYTNSGANQTFTVPGGVTSINIRAWGAGGGGINTGYWPKSSPAGSGGFSTGTLAVTPGQVLTIVVGSGGAQNSSATSYGGGGGGGTTSAGRANAIGGSGGGYSGVFTTGNVPILIAGGGGGGTPGADVATNGGTTPYVGSGGGAAGGQDTNPRQSGRGGTQTAGGAGATEPGCTTLATAGSSLQGGNGAGQTNSNGEGGGGGGGGYFGGGGGACQAVGGQNGGGGGGSSYIGGPGLTAASTIAAPNASYTPNANCSNTAPTQPAATTNDQYVAGTAPATGTGVCSNSGGNGQVTLQFNAMPAVKVQKITVGGTGTFSFAQTNLDGTPGPITTTAANTAAPTTPTANYALAVSTNITLTETVASGYALTSASCTDANSAITGNTGAIGTLSGSTLTIPAANVKMNASFTCTFTNTKLPTLTLSKISQGGTGNFTFTGTNGWSSQAITTATPGTAVTGATQTLSAAATATTITEALPAGWQLTSVSCTGIGSGAVAVATSSFTLNSTATAAGNNIACTVTDSKTPTLKLQKITTNTTGTFSFTQTNLASTPGNITTASAGVAAPASPTAINVSTIGTAVTLTEGTNASFALTAASCSDANSAITGNTGAIGTLSGSTLTIPAANVKAGADFTCSFTNATLPTLTLTKLSQGGAGSFVFTGTNGWSSQTITTVTSGTSVNGTTQILSAASTATTITEVPPAGWQLTSVSCTGLGSGSVSTAGNSFTLDAAATAYGNNASCTITNVKTPTVKLQKTSTGTTGSFSFSQTNLVSTPANITTASAGVAAPASPTPINVSTIGTAVTLTEGSNLSFVLTAASCSDANSAITGNTGTIGTLSSSTLTIPAANVKAGADFTCNFTNAEAQPSLTVSKAASPTSASAVGTVISYTITVQNTGNVTLSSVSVSDPKGTLNCDATGTQTIASITPSQSKTCTMSYTVTQTDLDNNTSNAGISNTATATTTYNSVSYQASGSVTVTLNSNPSLSITKSANTAGPVSAGDVITYSFTVTNTGNVSITNVSVSDPMNTSVGSLSPSSETLSSDQSPTSDSTDTTSNNGVWSKLAPNDSVNFTATYTVTQQDIETLQ